MVEIRIHGRGGQGSVTAAELIAEAAFFDGKFSQAFPNFGVERRGAPVVAFARLDDRFIQLRSQIYEPNYILVQDATLISGTNVFAGARGGTVVLINTEKDASEIEVPKGVIVKTLSATKIGLEIIGRPIINTILLGAFAGLTGLIKMASVEKAIRERFTSEIAEKNVLAARRGFELLTK
ncbi:MAG: pyruvate ferredoxin oxidoreductase subunit gamma [bacterium]